MKNICSILTSLLLTASVCCTQQATAQAPQKMSYQSVIRNSSNVLLVSKQVGIKISILQGTVSGNAVYTETQTPTTNANGLVSLQIGTGANQTGTFAGIDWSAGPYFIKIETDPLGGSNYTITGTQELLSVPYAMYAAKSGDATTSWSRNGNAGTDEFTHFIGTTDEIPFIIRVNNKLAAYITPYEFDGSTSLGIQAGNHLKESGYGNFKSTAIGYQSLFSNQGPSNTAIGFKSLYSNTTGVDNTASGDFALGSNTTGFNNTANGLAALGDNTTGTRNVAMGSLSLRFNTTGTKNVAIGESSLLFNTTGTKNTALGTEADVVTVALTNATAIGFGAKVDASNKIQLGNSSVTDVNTSGTFTAAGFKKPAGTSSQYLMADGSTSTLIVATTMGTIGASSSANGGTITSGVLRLAPADATNGGIVTTGAQTFAGNKTLTGTFGVGTSTPAETAQLDVSSTTKGFLPPRMTSLQRNAIPTTPSDAGLTIWCRNCGNSGELQVFNGTAWINTMGLPSAPALGDSYQGGKVAYILVSGDPGYVAGQTHGLIAATSDQSAGIQWYNGNYIYTGAIGKAIGTGLSNTNTIIAIQGTAASYAAGLARGYTGGGFTDWYLPSKDELKKLYIEKELIGGFAYTYYWSSSESWQLSAWYENFSSGGQGQAEQKLSTFKVRAIRSF